MWVQANFKKPSKSLPGTGLPQIHIKNFIVGMNVRKKQVI